MDDEARAEIRAGMIRLVFALATVALTLAATSVTFRDRVRRWWGRAEVLVAEPRPAEPSDAQVAEMFAQVREITERGRDW